MIGVDGSSKLSVSLFESNEGDVRVNSGATVIANRTLNGSLGKEVEVNGKAAFVATTFELDSDATLFGNGTIFLTDSQIDFSGRIGDQLSINVSGSSKVYSFVIPFLLFC